MKQAAILLLFILLLGSCKKSEEDILIEGGSYIGTWVVNDHRLKITDSAGQVISDTTLVWYPQADVLTMYPDSTYEVTFKNTPGREFQRYCTMFGYLRFLHSGIFMGRFSVRSSNARLEFTYTEEYPEARRDETWTFRRK